MSWRTLEKAFDTSRGVTPVAHVRNIRLDCARHALGKSAQMWLRLPRTMASEARQPLRSNTESDLAWPRVTPDVTSGVEVARCDGCYYVASSLQQICGLV